MADAHDVTVIGAKEVEGIVRPLDNRETGHFGKAKIVADMGFHLAEGYGYGSFLS